MREYIIQALTAGITSVGFAILFNIRGRQLALIGFGGTLSWVAYLAFFIPGDNAILALFGSTVLVALTAEIGARIIKTPVITLLVPMLIPLIPGGDLYRTMSYLVSSDMDAFASMSQFAMKEACAIAFGILTVTLFVQIILKTIRYLTLLRPAEKLQKR